MKSPLPKREMELLRKAVEGQDQWQCKEYATLGKYRQCTECKQHREVKHD